MKTMLRALVASALVFLLASCATAPRQESCPAGTQDLPDCPPIGAIDDPQINELWAGRSWMPPEDHGLDLVAIGKNAEIPVQSARARFLGPTAREAIESLAVKLWMIENADHTIDFSYYIFKTDLVGYALLGALCNAVQRGVDIRVTVDSAGSIGGVTHPALRALETCADDAGFMRNEAGELTTRKARVQVVIFNAITKLGNPNRRSHDKLLVKDGNFEAKSAVITGGRNISEDYYGIRDDGTPDADPFRDAELLVRSKPDVTEEDITVGELAENYSTVLFLLDKNKRIRPRAGYEKAYRTERMRSQDALRRLKGYDYFRPHYEAMDTYMNTGFHDAYVRLAHELGNLTDRRVVSEASENESQNPNSIMHVLGKIADQVPDVRTVRIVSPYLFLARYTQGDEVVQDDAADFHAWLKAHPDTRLEIITNSVLTSDNFPAQSIIDMETAPRLLLPPDMREQWLNLETADEATSKLVNSETWAELTSHPRLQVYETGRLDSVLLGGDQNYGKLHAKFLLTDQFGFVGTTNFDYRSRLYNNEMGFFFHGEALAADVHRGFDELKASSYRWGSPEWFELRRAVMEKGGMKGNSTRQQRGWYKFFKRSGIIWLL